MKIRVSLFCIWVFCCGLIFCGCLSSSSGTVDVGGVEVPTVYGVVGEKKVTGRTEKAQGNIVSLSLVYDSKDVSESDTMKFVNYLQRSGYHITKEAKSEGDLYTIQLGKDVLDSGKLLLVDISYSADGKLIVSYRVGFASSLGGK